MSRTHSRDLAAVLAPRISAVLEPVLRTEPDRPALIAPDRTLTYAELDYAASHAAGALLSLGLRPGDRLAVSLPNDSRIVVLFHAAMRLGAIWVGVNRALTEPEQAAILRHSGARLAIGCREPATAAEPVLLTEAAWDEALRTAPPAGVLPPVDPHSPAAIAYTSGTTGRPKGVVHSQHNLLVPGAVLSMLRGYDHSLRKADCLPMTILNLLVLSTLLASQAGGTAIISDLRDAGRIPGWLADTRATVWNGVPPMLYDLARDDAIDQGALAGLAEVWSGGDSLSDELRAAVTAKFGCRIIGTYGLTEAPSVVAIEDLDRPHLAGGSGTVLPHLRVLTSRPDATGPAGPGAEPAGPHAEPAGPPAEPAGPPAEPGGPAAEPGGPAAEPAELLVTGASAGDYAGLYTPMLGYWEDPAATAAALSGRVLHTGDLGRVDAAGQVFITDRRTLVILRGGANVYPAEVERAIATCPGVIAVAAIPVPDDRLGSRVGAVVQVAEGSGPDASGLTAHCRPLLARYKTPERWQLTTAALPRNAMGKLDRQRLTAEFAES